MTGDFYILEGTEVVKVAGLEEWSRRMEMDNRHVAVTEIAPGVVVSTVFLGIDPPALSRAAPVVRNDGLQRLRRRWDAGTLLDMGRGRGRPQENS